MKSFWKIAAPVTCIAAICVAAILWQVYKHNASERKLAETASVYHARAEQGDARAESDLAYMYSHGQGVPQDYAEALRWRRKAADQGYSDGEDGLAYMYLHGQGVPQDYTEALRWYRRAADRGDAKAQDALGFMYSKGEGAQQDYAEALRWYRKAVDQGYAVAEYDLGNMYYYGRGVQQDRAEADRWYHKAADQGDEYAQRFLGLRGSGPTTFYKVTLSIAFLGSSFLLMGSLSRRRTVRDWQQRTAALTGLLGLSSVGLDLYGYYHIGRLQPGLGVDAFYFAKHALRGAFIILGISIVFSLVRAKRAKITLEMIGVVFASFNIFAIAHHDLRRFVPAIRLFTSINGLLIGMSIPLAIFLWQGRAGGTENRDRGATASEGPAENDLI